MRDRIIITLPICPYDNVSVGKMTTPILCESLAKSMNSSFIMSINKISSYDTREYNSFIDLMKAYHINVSDYWVDYENKEKLLDSVYRLINKGYIIEKEIELLECECGRVEIPTSNLKSINMLDSLMYTIDDKYYCRCCHHECKTKHVCHLIFNNKNFDISTLQFYPYFIDKDRKTFDSTVGSNDIVISRDRNTGITINYDTRYYNLDVDFLWEVYLSLFSAKEKIVVCCNHQLYQLYMVGMLDKCFNDNSNTLCLATPYLQKNTGESELKNRIMSLKLFSLLSQKWSKKENIFDTGLLKYINSMNVDKKQMLYDIMLEEIECSNQLDKDVNYVLTKKYNFQNANNELKRRRNNNV